MKRGGELMCFCVISSFSRKTLAINPLQRNAIYIYIYIEICMYDTPLNI